MFPHQTVRFVCLSEPDLDQFCFWYRAPVISDQPGKAEQTTAHVSQDRKKKFLFGFLEKNVILYNFCLFPCWLEFSLFLTNLPFFTCCLIFSFFYFYIFFQHLLKFHLHVMSHTCPFVVPHISSLLKEKQREKLTNYCVFISHTLHQRKIT